MLCINPVHRLTESEPTLKEWERGILNLIFDNADIDTRTLTGLNTWHVLGGAAATTPSREYEEPLIPRSTTVRHAEELGHLAEIPIRKYKKPAKSGLRKVVVQPLDSNIPEPKSMAIAQRLDTMWMSSYTVCERDTYPSWGGFNQTVMKDGEFHVSHITITPFVNDKPNNLDTIYSAGRYAQILAKKYNIQTVFVTFDQPLYIKCSDIVLNSDDLTRVVPRLGGFHLVMSYMGAMCTVMSCSGLQTMWEKVYAPKSVKHMLTGSAYSRALRAHILTVAAIVSHLLDTPNCLSGINISKVQSVYESLLNGECVVSDILQERSLTQLTQVLEDLKADYSSAKRTRKLWINYLEMVHLLLLFIRAGDWDLHIYL